MISSSPDTSDISYPRFEPPPAIIARDPSPHARRPPSWLPPFIVGDSSTNGDIVPKHCTVPSVPLESAVQAALSAQILSEIEQCARQGERLSESVLMSPSTPELRSILALTLINYAVHRRNPNIFDSIIDLLAGSEHLKTFASTHWNKLSSEEYYVFVSAIARADWSSTSKTLILNNIYRLEESDPLTREGIVQALGHIAYHQRGNDSESKRLLADISLSDPSPLVREEAQAQLSDLS